MEETKLTFVQTLLHLLVGEMSIEKTGNMKKPRVVQMDHEKGMVNLVPLLGSPDSIDIHPNGKVFTYANNDEELTAFYDVEVKGYPAPAPAPDEPEGSIKIVK